MNDWLNARIFHPLARRLALRLQPTGITPNAVSIIGGLCIVAAGLLYQERQQKALADRLAALRNRVTYPTAKKTKS